jgi:hypothetical protein
MTEIHPLRARSKTGRGRQESQLPNRRGAALFCLAAEFVLLNPLEYRPLGLSHGTTNGRKYSPPAGLPRPLLEMA